MQCVSSIHIYINPWDEEDPLRKTPEYAEFLDMLKEWVEDYLEVRCQQLLLQLCRWLRLRCDATRNRKADSTDCPPNLSYLQPKFSQGLTLAYDVSRLSMRVSNLREFACSCIRSNHSSMVGLAFNNRSSVNELFPP